MRRGSVILLQLTLIGGIFGGLEAQTPDSAVYHTWQTIQDGSPSEFLYTLHNNCADSIMDICRDYLEVLREMSNEDLGELFAGYRLEAAPNEVEFWDETAVLEMILSSPGQQHILENCFLLIDSLHSGDSVSTVFASLTIEGCEAIPLEIPVVTTPLGLRVSGLESYLTCILDRSIPR